MSPPYPFGRAYTLMDFIEQACRDHLCEYFQDDRKLVSPDGEEIFLQELSHDVVMEPSVLRSYCNLLNLPAEDFGVNLQTGGSYEYVKSRYFEE